MPVVRVEGEMDPHTAGSLQEAMRTLWVETVARSSLTSRTAAISAVRGWGSCSLVSRARQNGGRVAAVQPPMQVLRILQLVRMTDERGFQVFADPGKHSSRPR